ncbi:Uncharacterized protein LSUE1_G004615, partial [Lachnellula suecica]
WPENLQNTAPKQKSFLRRALGALGIVIVFGGAGFAMSAVPAFKAADGFINPPSDEETLLLYTPEDDVAKEIDEFIKNHPVSVELRAKPEFTEARPHLKIPPSYRAHNLTGGTLLGTDKVAVPPYVWSEDGGKSLVSISYLGNALCGHPGIIHGGMLATILDEGLARCCFGALPNKVGMTANLNINYRAPAKAGQFVVLRAKTTKVEGRKAWVEGHIETLVAPGETPLVLVEASALFIEPRQAANMARVYPVK